ncbi:unnamed protein product [Wickerhamomyces anomalus]
MATKNVLVLLHEVHSHHGTNIYNPLKLYYCTNVCSAWKRRVRIGGEPKLIPKVEVLCPLCHPFNERDERLGVVKKPIFYDTLTDEYLKHMGTKHGVSPSFNAELPFIGFLVNNKSYRLRAICPFKDSNEPCLKMSGFCHNADGNLLSGYYWHIWSDHIENDHSSDREVYKPTVCVDVDGQTVMTNNYFIPLDAGYYHQTLKEPCDSSRLGPFRTCQNILLSDEIADMLLQEREETDPHYLKHTLQTPEYIMKLILSEDYANQQNSTSTDPPQKETLQITPVPVTSHNNNVLSGQDLPRGPPPYSSPAQHQSALSSDPNSNAEQSTREPSPPFESNSPPSSPSPASPPRPSRKPYSPADKPAPLPQNKFHAFTEAEVQSKLKEYVTNVSRIIIPNEMTNKLESTKDTADEEDEVSIDEDEEQFPVIEPIESPAKPFIFHDFEQYRHFKELHQELIDECIWKMRMQYQLPFLLSQLNEYSPVSNNSSARHLDEWARCMAKRGILDY